MAVTVASSSEMYTASPPGTITKPSGVAVGDILVLVVFGKWNSGQNATCSTFTQFASANTGGEGLTALYRVADSGDVSASNYSVTNGGGEIEMAYMLRITGGVNDFTQYTTQTGVGNGVFSTLDITPNYANSLIVFAQWNVAYTGSLLAGWAIVTSNPSWTVAQEDVGNNGNAFGSSAIVWAVRPEVTSTGDFSITDPGVDQMAVAFVIPPQIDVTVSPAVVEATFTVQDPSVSGGANVSPAVVDATFTIPTPTVSVPTPTITNEAKNVVSVTNEPKYNG